MSPAARADYLGNVWRRQLWVNIPEGTSTMDICTLTHTARSFLSSMGPGDLWQWEPRETISKA